MARVAIAVCDKISISVDVPCDTEVLICTLSLGHLVARLAAHPTRRWFGHFRGNDQRMVYMCHHLRVFPAFDHLTPLSHILLFTLITLPKIMKIISDFAFIYLLLCLSVCGQRCIADNKVHTTEPFKPPSTQ